MLGLRQLRIKSKVTIILLIVSLGSVATVSLLTWQRAKTILTQRIFYQLTSVRSAKSAEIEFYFQFMYAQIETLAEDRMIVTAMTEFNQAFDLLNQNPTEASEPSLQNQLEEPENNSLESSPLPIPASWQQAIENYYTEEFFPRLSQAIEGELIVELYQPQERAAQYLQYHYIANNPKPVGQKDELMQAEDGSEYSQIHSLYHPLLRNLIIKFGYYDLFLIDHQTGHIVYSVYKETDYGTSLKDGPYANSNFAEAIEKVRKNPEPGAVQIVDFASYRPSYGAPAAFFAAPIYDGTQQVGILAAQLPVDRINDVLTGNQNWQNEGLGESGEVYLVGSDHLMRSISRFLIQDKEGYLAALQQLGTPEETLQNIKLLETSILLQTVKTEGVLDAFQGESGTKIIDDYRGIPVLSSYDLVDIRGVSWVILAEMDLAEAYQPLYSLQQYILTITVVLVFIVTSLALLSANSLVRPIRLLIEDSRKIAGGDFEEGQLHSSSQDELGSLVENFNEILKNLKEQQKLVVKKEQQYEKLLHHIVPQSVGDRLKNGETKIVNTTEQATVLVASLEGLNYISKVRKVDESADLLHELMNGFHEAAAGLDVLSITPIGELFFAVCGLAVPRLDHTKRIIDLSLDMVEMVKGFNHKYEHSIILKIGIATGEIIGAAIDDKSLNYYLWGTTVLIAEVLNREAKPGAIQVIEEVYESVKDLYGFEPSVDIEIPKIGSLKTWTVNPSKSHSQTH